MDPILNHYILYPETVNMEERIKKWVNLLLIISFVGGFVGIVINHYFFIINSVFLFGIAIGNQFISYKITSRNVILEAIVNEKRVDIAAQLISILDELDETA